MIDAENYIFTVVAEDLRAKHPGIFVTGDIVSKPSQFPCVSFYESDNYTARDRLDTSPTIGMRVLAYRADVYSNKAGQKKTEAKQILSDIEDILYKHDFVTDARTVLNDMGDTIHHKVATFRVRFDGEHFYRP